MKWLQEALADVCGQPSETDILKAALTVLKVRTYVRHVVTV